MLFFTKCIEFRKLLIIWSTAEKTIENMERDGPILVDVELVKFKIVIIISYKLFETFLAFFDNDLSFLFSTKRYPESFYISRSKAIIAMTRFIPLHAPTSSSSSLKNLFVNNTLQFYYIYI